MFALIRRDVGDGSKDIRTMSSGPLDTVSMVDPSLSSFMIHIKVLEIVVEIYRSRTEVASEKSCVRSEYRRDVNVSLSAAARRGKVSMACYRWRPGLNRKEKKTYRGMARPASHSWKWATMAFLRSWVVN